MQQLLKYVSISTTENFLESLMGILVRTINVAFILAIYFQIAIDEI